MRLRRNRLAALAVVLASAGSVNAHGPARVPGFISTVIEEPPASVQEAPERDHSIFAWPIPALANGKRVAIRGVLGWAGEEVGVGGGDDATPL